MISLRPGASCCRRLAILLTLLSANALHADDTIVHDTVATRARPEVDPLGAHVGSFLIYPKLTFSYLHDDNVLINSGEKKGSYVTETSPEVAARSNWSKHALNLLANATFARFADFPNENYDDWLISTDGRLDLTPEIQLAGGAGAQKSHILRTSPENTSNLDEPITYNENSVFGSYTQMFGHYRLGLDAAVHKQDYHSTLGLVGGVQTLINEDERDRTQRTAGLRVGYEVYPGEELYLLLKRDRRIYSEPAQLIIGPNQIIKVKRSSDGKRALLGMTFDQNGIIFGDLSAGYLRQDYLDPFPDIHKPLVGASVNWNFTRLSTAYLAVQRDVGETTSSYFSGYVSTSTLLGIDHELRRHVLVSISVNHESDDFQGIDFPGIGTAERKDSSYDFSAGPTYLINRNFRLSVLYHRLKRNSTDNTLPAGVTNDYLKNVILIQFQAQPSP